MNKNNYIAIPIPPDILEWAIKIAQLLDEENEGSNTMDGGKEKNVKGSLGQWAIAQWLSANNWLHDYSQPYIPKQYGDPYDLFVNGIDIWDVKCRDWLDTIDKYGSILMGENEQKSTKKCDYYMFCTPDREYKNIYIIGGITKSGLWNNIIEISEKVQERLLYRAAGKIWVSRLKPIHHIITHT